MTPSTPESDLQAIAAQILSGEREDVAAVLSNAYEQDFGRATLYPQWRVRELIGYLLGALHQVAKNDAGQCLDPAASRADVGRWSDLPPQALVGELDAAYAAAELAPGALRGAAEIWIIGGDLREALNSPEAYGGPLVPGVLRLLVRESVLRALPPVDVTLTDAADRGLDSAHVCLGDPALPAEAWLRTDASGLVRIVAARRVELVERDVVGIDLADLVMFPLDPTAPHGV